MRPSSDAISGTRLVHFGFPREPSTEERLMPQASPVPEARRQQALDEYQILDNAVHADGKNPRTSAASLYFCMQPSEDATRPVGQWNTARIVCQGTVVQHWLNDVKVIHFDYADPKWASHVDLLKERGGDLEARGANLSLQDHGDPVWFRNLRIRALEGDEAIDGMPVTPATIPEDVLAAEAAKLKGIVQRREAAKAKQKNKKK